MLRGASVGAVRALGGEEYGSLMRTDRAADGEGVTAANLIGLFCPCDAGEQGHVRAVSQATRVA